MKSNDSALHADPLLPLVGYFLRVGTWGSADRETLSFDVAEVERIIGRKGRVSGGVWHLSVPRGEKFTEEGMEAPPSWGWQLESDIPSAKGRYYRAVPSRRSPKS